MLYDEKGYPYCEPPLLPEEAHVFHIVRHYQTMYKENQRAKEKIQKLRDTISRQNGLIYAQFRLIYDIESGMDRLVRMLHKKDQKIPADILNTLEAIQNMTQKNDKYRRIGKEFKKRKK